MYHLIPEEEVAGVSTAETSFISGLYQLLMSYWLIKSIWCHISMGISAIYKWIFFR